MPDPGSERSKPERLAYLDGWRGLAIACVLVAHFTRVKWMDLGRFGVDLFFVLSGLLMSRILFEQRTPIRKFYRRRISRIMPVFLLFVFTCWFGWAHRGAHWQELVTTLTFTRTYYTHPGIWQSVLPDGNLWSLNVEEQCYVILATIAALAPRRATLILLALAALTLPAWKLHLHFSTNLPYELTIECASAGLFLSAAYREIAPKWRPPQWAPIAALLVASICYVRGIQPWYLSVTLAPVMLAFSVNHIQGSWQWLVRGFEWKPLCQLGVLSYSIYLWQQIFYLSQPSFPYHTAVVAALLTGAASFYLFENPARRWLNEHWGRPKRAAAAAAPCS